MVGSGGGKAWRVERSCVFGGNLWSSNRHAAYYLADSDGEGFSLPASCAEYIYSSVVERHDEVVFCVKNAIKSFMDEVEIDVGPLWKLSFIQLVWAFHSRTLVVSVIKWFTSNHATTKHPIKETRTLSNNHNAIYSITLPEQSTIRSETFTQKDLFLSSVLDSL